MVGLPDLRKPLTKWFPFWVQSEVLIHDFFAYLKNLRHERLNHSIVPLGGGAAGQAHRLQIITDLETTFQSRKNAWIVKLKAKLAFIAASCATSAGRRSHNVNKEHVFSCGRLILKVIDFDPFPDPSFVSLVHHIPPAPVYYVDMYPEQWGAFWKSSMTGDVFTSFYHCLSEVINIEANFNHPIMKKIMAATVGEAAMDTWEYYPAPRRENAHRQKHPNAHIRKATKEVHDKLVRYNFRDVFTNISPKVRIFRSIQIRSRCPSTASGSSLQSKNVSTPIVLLGL